MPEYSFLNSSSWLGKTSLVSVKLPAGLTSIGSYAFDACCGLTSISNLSLTPKAITIGDIYGVNQSACTLTVPTLSVGLYAAADVWKDFTGIAGGGITFATKVDNPALGSVSGTEQGLYASGTAISITATSAAG
jgi:hypothetical protein